MAQRPGVSLGAAALAVFMAGATPAAAQTVRFYSFDPLVVPSTRTAPVLLKAEIAGQPTRVTLDLNIAARETLDLKDDGRDGDERAGDGVYTVRLAPADLVRAMQPADVQRVFVGFLNVFNGATNVLRGNMFADVYTNDVDTTAIARLSPDVQITSRLVNINDPTFFADFSLTRIAQQFYRLFADEYDFLNIISTPARFANRSHVTVSSGVEGIGIARLDNTRTYGSAGRLLGISQFPSPGFYDGANNGYNHETGHQWINFLNVAPFSSGIPHWPISSMASRVMGWGQPGGQGLDFACNVVEEGGTIRLLPRPDAPAFSDLDLYLMGLMGADEVRDQIVFADQTQRFMCAGETFTGAVTRVNAQDIIRLYGPRKPDVTTSPKRFRVATILASRDGLVSPETMWLYTWLTARVELKTATRIHEGFTAQVGRPSGWRPVDARRSTRRSQRGPPISPSLRRRSRRPSAWVNRRR